MELQNRTKSILFWVGMVAAVYEAVVASLTTAGVAMHPVFGAIGVGLAAVLIYCNGNNPSLQEY